VAAQAGATAVTSMVVVSPFSRERGIVFSASKMKGTRKGGDSEQYEA
jgi:hypothetical protein